jgi:hypothetical protein
LLDSEVPCDVNANALKIIIARFYFSIKRFGRHSSIGFLHFRTVLVLRIRDTSYAFTICTGKGL